MHQIDKIDPDSIFQRSHHDKTRGHSMKLFKIRANLDIRKHFFSNRVVDDWNQLPESAVSAPTLLCFKKQLAKIMGL